MTGTTEDQEHPPLPDSIDRTGSGGSNGTSFSQKKRMDLADLLRDCAALVEQNEMDQKVFQRMFRELTEYVSGHGGVKPPDSSVPKRSSNAAAAAAANAATDPAPAASSQTPFDEPPPAAAEPAVQNTSSRNVAQDQQPYSSQPPHPTPPPSARKVTTTTTKHIPPPSSARSVHDQHQQNHGAISKEKNIKFFDKIKHAAKEAGQEFSNIAHTGQQALSSAAKKATSAKNAQRAREDIASEFGEDWHEERRANYQERNAERRASANSDRHHNDSSQANTRPPNPSKPPFQRPVNPNSTLIANGWLEQQRRSKMRFVWKEVLVSLVAGRRPGEETTLWVQRETTNPVTGNMGLEALHQIPIKGMQDINYVDFSTDHRFIIQVYNLSDEFVFRTRDNGDAAKNWVSTLRLTREAVLNGVAPPKPGDLQTHRTKTHPSYSGEDEKKAESPPHQQHQHQQQQPPPPPPQQQQQPAQQQQQHPRKMAVKELRAIAHAHGVNTAGMERSQLEAAVARIQQQNEGRATPAAGGPPAAQRTGSEDEAEREAARRRQMRKDEETAARYAAEERDRAEAERRRMVEAEEQRRRQQHAEYLRQQEIHRQQQAQQQAQAQAAAQMRAEEERRRYQQQQQYYAQQQAQAQAQQAAAQQAAAQQQYYAQQQAAQQQYYAQQQAQQQNFHRQQTPPPGAHPQPGGHSHPPPPQGHQGPPPGQQQQQPHGNPNKWANIIAGEDPDKEEDGQAAITAIKHHILIQWALQPPTMQVLRPIHGLLTTVHTVFPPTQGVPGHEYFKKWKTVSMESISDESGQPDENKLAKAVKKLRFFLHPDKLPRDLNEEQSFVCKMLWDVTSDAWEEYEKQKEQLDWLNQPGA